MAPAKKRDLNARTVEYLARNGYIAAVVEKYNAHAGRTQDLFGFVDVLAINEAGRATLLQVTSKPNVSARIAKMASPALLPIVIELAERGVVFLTAWGPAGEKEPVLTRVTAKVLSGVRAGDSELVSQIVSLMSPHFLAGRDGRYFVLATLVEADELANRLQEELSVSSHVITNWNKLGEVCVWPLWKEALKTDRERLAQWLN